MIFLCVPPPPHFSLFSPPPPPQQQICMYGKSPFVVASDREKEEMTKNTNNPLVHYLPFCGGARMLLLVVVSKHNAFTYNEEEEEEEEDPLEIFFSKLSEAKTSFASARYDFFLPALPRIFGETGRGVGDYARKCNNETNFFL